MSSDLWQRGCERLALELPEQQFNTWIRPLPGAELREHENSTVLTLRVPNRFKLDWIRTQYAPRIETLMSELAGKPVRLELQLAVRETAPERPVPRLAAVPAINGHLPGSTPQVVPASSPPAPGSSKQRLNSALTFDTLVPGRANQMARTAALHVAGAPGHMYNPLFIYGGVGLGKTHLIHAVGNALLRDKPDARVLYLHAEQFITDVVRNYQRKTTRWTCC
jgi:chromosomal replication initiator protein